MITLEQTIAKLKQQHGDEAALAALECYIAGRLTERDMQVARAIRRRSRGRVNVNAVEPTQHEDEQ